MDEQQCNDSLLNSKIIISDIKQNTSANIMSTNELVSPTKSDSLKKLSFSIDSILEKNDTMIDPLSKTNAILHTLNNNNYKLIKNNSNCSKRLLSLTNGRQKLINENQPRLPSDLGLHLVRDSKEIDSKNYLKSTYPNDGISLSQTSNEVSLLIPSYHHHHQKTEQSPKIKNLRSSVDAQTSDCHTSSDEIDESLDDDYSKDSDDVEYSLSSRQYPLDSIQSHGNNYHSDRHDIHEMMHRKKKTRTVFSRSQIFQLEATFDMKRYLSSADRANLAQALHLTEQQVKIWFQNRRNKLKRQIVEASQSVNAVSAVLQNAVSQNTPTPVISSVSANQNGSIKRPLPVTPTDILNSKLGGHRFESFLYSPTSAFFDQLAASAAAAAVAQNLGKSAGTLSGHDSSSSSNGHSGSSGYSFQDFYVNGITHVA
ncbi:unnamed protein product [Didymodactylos carnosus]|uniref:Homeobox domain-containing protein n=1 Tax=Didymodactylos carnosus TaxID=1234261 RepID=A0A813S5H3_9BILA|nr:unnamed protein product [Didymodactylos carnosus]CAF1445721.1 unnamed protein product [Didymodactylos carnosus]CAF3579777.1 unnamed protein product [Didymodactylos carnosus]CAF4241200.1 unnamed protein product [Didymodactylos carnosus]